MKHAFHSLLILLVLFCSVTSADEPVRKTRLRVVKGPTGIFENRYGRLTVTHVTVEVKNVGSVPAEDIRVIATLPNGATKKLRGPGTLEKYERAVYESSTSEYVTTDKKLKATMTCSNCYN